MGHWHNRRHVDKGLFSSNPKLMDNLAKPNETLRTTIMHTTRKGTTMTPKQSLNNS